VLTKTYNYIDFTNIKTVIVIVVVLLLLIISMLFLVCATTIMGLEVGTARHLSTFGKQLLQRVRHKGHKDDPPSIMDGINDIRAEQCAGRADPMSHPDCAKFMKKMCNPAGDDGQDGGTAEMDGEAGEKSSGKGFCKKFFNAEEKEKEEVKKEEPKVEEPKVEKHEEEKEIKKHEPEPDAMNLPSQGFEGPPVHHDDKTQIANWMKEYGPKGQSHDYWKICREHPENAWCQLKGYSSLAFPMAILSPLVALLIFA